MNETYPAYLEKKLLFILLILLTEVININLIFEHYVQQKLTIYLLWKNLCHKLA